MAKRTFVSTKIRQWCRFCGNSFMPGANTKGMYCSRDCHWNYDRQHYRGTTENGYIIIYPDPRLYPRGTKYPGARPDGRVLEHRYVVQEAIRRPLEPNETIHHIDGDKTNNSIDNLEIWIGNHGRGIRQEDYHCPGCQCFERDSYV